WQCGQRGNHRTRTRAMARRAVMKESSKWRSCRAFERVARTRPSARGGKMPQALAGNERIAAEDDGDVVMPAAKGAPLVVVEAELTLEVFVDALGAPAFLGDPHELLSTGLLAQPRERVVGGGLLAVRPFDQKPVVTAISVACVDLEHGEARTQRATTSLLPRRRAECAAWQRARQGLDRHGRRGGCCFRCTSHDRVGVDSDSVFEVEPPKAGAELSNVAVGGIGERDTLGQSFLDRALHHLEGDLPLRAEPDVARDLRPVAARAVTRPRLGQVQLHVDRHMLGRRAECQAHADLAVGDLADRPRVLPLHAGRLAPLLHESGVVDHPCADALPRLHRVHCVSRRELADRPVVPLGPAGELQPKIVRPPRGFGVIRCCRRQRLDTLSLVLAEDPHRIERERRATTFLSEPRTDSLEVRFQTNHPLRIQLVGHAPPVSCLGSDGKVSCSSARLFETPMPAKRINDAGVVAGDGWTYEHNQMTHFGWGSYVNTYDTNNRGEVVGQAGHDPHGASAFLYKNGKMLDLGNLGGVFARAIGINDRSEVVGYSTDADGAPRAFVRHRQDLHDLNSLVQDCDTWILEVASAINNAGQISVSGRLRGKFKPFTLHPLV